MANHSRTRTPELRKTIRGSTQSLAGPRRLRLVRKPTLKRNSAASWVQRRASFMQSFWAKEGREGKEGEGGEGRGGRGGKGRERREGREGEGGEGRGK